MKDAELACDITQEAFLEIIRSIGGLKEPLAFVSWMKQVTYSKCTRYFSKRQDKLIKPKGNSKNQVVIAKPDYVRQ